MGRVPPLEALGTPRRRQGLCSHQAHLRATADFAPRFEALGTPPPPPPPDGTVYVATRPWLGYF